MPNRIVREGFLDSERVDQLDWFAECVYHRMLLAADDAGRLDGRSSVLKSRLFPLKARLREREVERAVRQIEQAGLLERWSCQGREVLQLTTWRKCGNSLTSKYPDRNGNYTIRYVAIPAPQGMCEYVASSVPEEQLATCRAPPNDGIRMGSIPHTDPMPMGFVNEDGDEDGDGDERRRRSTETKRASSVVDVVVDVVVDNEKLARVREAWQQVAALWPGGRPHRRDIKLVLQLLVAALLHDRTWALVALRVTSERRPQNPGAYLQKVSRELASREEYLWLRSLPIPPQIAELAKPPPKPATPDVASPRPPDEPPPPEECQAMSSFAREQMELLRRMKGASTGGLDGSSQQLEEHTR